MNDGGALDVRTHGEAKRVPMQRRTSTIRFTRPTATLPISLTGNWCALNCAHCGGHYLTHMRPVWHASPNGAKSLLISGGCDAQGRVPVTRHLETIANLRPGHRLNWHVGFIEEEAIKAIQPYVDVISFDVIGDAETAREVYGLNVSLDEYVETLGLLRRYAPVVPHITIGLHGGQIRGEYQAIDALRSLDIDRLILIVFIPTPGTRYASCAPPALDEASRVLAYARQTLPEARLYLGCMRPHGVYRQRLDQVAVANGFDLIVNPTQTAIKAANAAGLSILWGDECCALY